MRPVYDDSEDFTILGVKYRVEGLDAKQPTPKSKRTDDYLYYASTSGTVSTTPSVVQVSCDNFLQNIDFFRHRLGGEVGDVSCILSPLTFDPAILTLFEAIFNCGRIVLFSTRAVLDGRRVVNALADTDRLRQVFLTPSLFRRFSALRDNNLSHVLLGGEVAPSHGELVNVFGSKVRFWNLYGLTELSVWSSMVEIRCEDGTVPIYRPQSNGLVNGTTEFTTTDSGELVIHINPSRQCIVNGVPVPLKYKSGDVVAIGSNGEFYFSHRAMGLKRRGMKVTLNAVQQNLTQHDAIDQAHIFQADDKIIAALFLTEPVLDERAFCLELVSTRRPTGPIPDSIQILPYTIQQAPLTQNQKLNTKAIESEVRVLLQSESSSSLTDAFDKILESFLGSKRSQTSQTFFELGGDSLEAMLCVNLLRPPREFLNRFLTLLKSAPLAKVFDELAKVDEVKQHETVGAVNIGGYVLNKVLSGADSELISVRTVSSSDSSLTNITEISPRWRIDTGSCADCEPFTFYGGGEYHTLIGCHDGSIICCNVRSGCLSWRRKLSSKPVGYTIVSDRLIIAESSGFIHLINPTGGELMFSTDFDQSLRSTPISANGVSNTFIIAAEVIRSVSVTPSNEMVTEWQVTQSDGVVAKPFLDQAGSIYVATVRGVVIAIDHHGVVKWKRALKSPVFNQPQKYDDKLIVVAVTGSVFILSIRSGLESYRSVLSPCPIYASITIWQNYFYVANEAGDVFQFNINNNVITSFQPAKRIKIATKMNIVKLKTKMNFIISRTDGLIEVMNDSFETIASYQLPAESWSGVMPISVENELLLVVGTRDDKLNCLAVS